MTGQVGPEYQRLMDEIRAKIISGDYPVGKPIPSTNELRKVTGMSIPVIRRAVGQLETEGILEGHPGKGVYVIATPADVAGERQDIQALGEQVGALQREVHELAQRADEALDGDLARDVAELKETVGRVEANLLDLYQILGHAYPQGGADDSKEPAPKRRRTSQ